MFLLDTNVVSEMRRPAPSSDVRTWVESKPAEQQFLSAMSLLEITRGAARHSDPLQRSSLQRWIDSTLRVWFGIRVLSISPTIAESAGIWMAARERSGRPISLPDALIAATAIQHNFVLVTRNTKDFIELPLDIYDPWKNKLTPGEKRRL
jgi:predicted nucleic acid-binding protein